MTNKLYQYKDITKSGPVEYSGTLALKLLDDTQYNVSTPVNKAINYQENKDVIILNNTLDSTSSSTMKFNLSFKVNKDVIGVGTRNILDFPGLLSVKSENNTLWFKFYYEDAPAWKYINASELVDGWNNVSLVGDGVKVTLTVNSTVHTLVDGTPKYTIVNFPVKTESDQAILDQILASGKWEVSNGVLKNIKVDDSSGTAYAHFTLHTTKACLFSVNASISSEQNYDFGAVYIGSDIYEPTQSQLNEKTTDGKGNYLVIGSGTTLEGGPNTFVNADGDVSMKLAENTDYVISFAYAKDSSGASGDDCLSIYKYGTSADGPNYPTLSLGTLKTYQSWLYLKDIEAVKVGNQDSGGGTDTPDEPVYDDEGAPVQAKALPDGWAMWKIVSNEPDYTGTLWYRYTRAVPYMDSSNTYHGSGTVYILPDTSSDQAGIFIDLGSAGGVANMEYFVPPSYRPTEAKLILDKTKQDK